MFNLWPNGTRVPKMSKMLSISIPNAWQVVYSNARIWFILAGKVMFFTLADWSSSVVHFGVLVFEVKISLFWSQVAHIVVLFIDMLGESGLSWSEYIRVVMHDWRLLYWPSGTAKHWFVAETASFWYYALPQRVVVRSIRNIYTAR